MSAEEMRPPARPDRGIVPTDLGELDGIFRTTANRLGVALIIA